MKWRMLRVLTVLLVLGSAGLAGAAEDRESLDGWIPGCDPAAPQDVEPLFPCRRGEVRDIFLHLANGDVEVVEVEMIDGHAVFQGDILLPLDDDGHARLTAGVDPAELADAGVHGRAAGRSDAALLWTNRTVPFRIDGSLNGTMQGRVNDAIDHWEARTNLVFVQRTTETNFVTFQSGTGCGSDSVGMSGGEQRVFLSTACSTGNVIHEIGHVIGLWHEHTRADRDDHVIINWGNIINGFQNNFETYVALGENGADYGAFDFGSIMMYPSDAFTRNGLPTITRLDGSTFGAQRNALSTGDSNAANCEMYPRPITSASLTCWGNYSGSRQVTCRANVNGGSGPFTYDWSYSGTASSWHPSGSYAYAYYNSPGCNSSHVNFFWVNITDACGDTAFASMGSLPCW